jgi:hypothetical protein
MCRGDRCLATAFGFATAALASCRVAQVIAVGVLWVGDATGNAKSHLSKFAFQMS